MFHCQYKSSIFSSFLHLCCILLLLNDDEKGLTFVSAVQVEDQTTTTTTCSNGETATDGSCNASKYLENNTSSSSSSNSHNSDSKECKDNNKHCNFWAQYGECDNNHNYMQKYCRFSCGLCPNSHKNRLMVDDDDEEVDDGLQRGIDFGVAQYGIDISNEDLAFKIRENILQARKYMERTKHTLHPELMEGCKNINEKCTSWAVQGECDANPNYMKRKCGPACKSCEYLDMKQRCKFDIDEATKTNIWNPGDLNKMFEKLTSEPYLSKYEVQIMSSPETTNGPWVIVMENVISENEAERLIELGGIQGYKRSTGVGKLQPDGTHEAKVITTRTSTNAWCENECYTDNVTQTVVHRLSNITGIPDTNSEYLQLLKYEEGQFYNTHHDCIVDHGDRKMGVRIITAFLYLNDVASGGETEFPKLKLKVSPKRGRMVVWPSVFDNEPTKKDDRTVHGALKVTEGIKYGANAWFHLRDYKTVREEGCT